jgi:predicted CoA-binding protein
VDGSQILRDSSTILLIDYPGRVVPETLARSGLTVTSKEGPEPDNYARHEIVGDAVELHKIGAPPEHVDIVYSHRPVEELPGIVDFAQQLGARAVWCESGSPEAQAIVEGAGLQYVDAPPIGDATQAARRD